MLVINRIKLTIADELHDVRKLGGYDSITIEQDLHARNEINDGWNVGKNVIGNDQIAGDASVLQFGSGRRTEKCRLRRNALFDREPRNICRRFNTKYWNAARLEVLQKIAIIAGELDYQRLSVQPQGCDCGRGIPIAVI